MRSKIVYLAGLNLLLAVLLGCDIMAQRAPAKVMESHGMGQPPPVQVRHRPAMRQEGDATPAGGSAGGEDAAPPVTQQDLDSLKDAVIELKREMEK